MTDTCPRTRSQTRGEIPALMPVETAGRQKELGGRDGLWCSTWADHVERAHDLGEVTRHRMLAARPDDERRVLLRTDLLRLPASCPEATARRGVCRTGNVAFQHDPFALATQCRRLDRDRGQERLGVGMHRDLI